MRVGGIIRNTGGVAVSGGGTTTTLFGGGEIEVTSLGGGSWRVSAPASLTEGSADSKYQPIGSYLSGSTILFTEASAAALFQAKAPSGYLKLGMEDNGAVQILASDVLWVNSSYTDVIKYTNANGRLELGSVAPTTTANIYNVEQITAHPDGLYIAGNKWPTTAAVSGQALFVGAGGQLVWKELPGPTFTGLSAAFYNFNYAGWADLEGQYRFETTGVNLVNAPFTPNAAAVYTVLAEVHNCPVTNTHFVRINLASFGDWGNNNRMFVRMGPDFASAQSLGWRQYLNDQGIVGKGGIETRVSANRVVVSAPSGFTEASATALFQTKNTVVAIDTTTTVSGGNRNTIFLLNAGAEIVLLNQNWVGGDRIEIIATVSGVSVSAGAGITLNAASSAAGVTFDTPFAGATIIFTTATEAYAIGRLA